MPRINPNLLIAKLEKQLKTLKQREAATRIGAQKRALSKIVKLANSAGLNADAIAAALNKSGTKRRGQNKSKLTSENKRARTKVAPKYRNPADTSQVWTGRGKPPAWAAPLKAAGTLNTVLIHP